MARQYFDMSNWVGGLNTSLDESQIQPNQLTRADNIQMTVRGSKKRREGLSHYFNTNTIKHTFTDANVDTSTEVITITAHTFEDGDAVWITTSGTMPTGLSASTLYYVIWDSADTIKLATTAANAVAGTAINITAAGSGTFTIYSRVKIIAGFDYWYYASNAKTQRYMLVGDNGRIYSCTTSGTITLLSAASSAGATGTSSVGTTRFTPGILRADMCMLNNKIFICAEHPTTGQVPLLLSNTTITAVTGFPASTYPSVCSVWFGRIWCNSLAGDRLFYSGTNDETKWGGSDDSGAIDIGVNDEDPEGITAIFPPFQGVLHVAKRTKLYRITDSIEELFEVIPVSTAIGCVAQDSITTIDNDDIFFLSERGVHSLAATATAAAFEATFVSGDIQGSIKNSWVKSQLKYAKAAYLSDINCYMISVCETDDLDLTTSGPAGTAYEVILNPSNLNNSVWLYNIPYKAWYRWPNISAQCMFVANDSDKKRVYFGTHVKRLTKTFNDTLYDTTTQNTNQAVQMYLETGRIYVDENTFTHKGFKQLSLLYQPIGTHTITCGVYVDSYTPDATTGENSITFSSTGSSALLGSTFILGTSAWGGASITEPSIVPIYGYGKSIKLTFAQSGVNEEGEIQGFGIVFTPAGTKQAKAQEG